MKKLLIGLFAFALCMGINSCAKENKEAAEKAGEEVVEAVEKTPVLADIVAKAKAEGANWSVDEWKEQFKQVLLAIKPMMVELSDMAKQAKEIAKTSRIKRFIYIHYLLLKRRYR